MQCGDAIRRACRVLRAALVVDRDDDVAAAEVQDLLQLLGGDVQQIPHAAGNALEEPDVADRSGELDVAHALAPHLGARDLDAAALADDALVAHALVLAAVALPVLGGTEDALAEQTVALGLERAVVDRLRLVTSPLDHVSICLGEARPMRMESKLLMSITCTAPLCGVAGWSSVSYSSMLLEPSSGSRSCRSSSAGIRRTSNSPRRRCGRI